MAKYEKEIIDYVRNHPVCITSYLDLFDEFCDEVRRRYEEDVIKELPPEAMITLYRGFIAYMAG